LLVCVLPCISADFFTKADEKIILDRHNYFRRERVKVDKATNMRLMQWHDGIAKTASDWANVCKWEHGWVRPFPESVTYENLGQNLWKGSRLNPEGSVNAWHSEIDYYTYTTRACQQGKMCGHYTQVTWSTSYEMGCGYKKCETFTIIACNYGPPGNYKGVFPFQINGPPCSRCLTGTGWCDSDGNDGLCVDYKCTGPGAGCHCPLRCENGGSMHPPSCKCFCRKGWMGTTCSEKCADSHKNCNAGWWPFMCKDPQYDSYNTQCKAMCCLCEPDGESTCEAITAPPYDYTTLAPAKSTRHQVHAITLFFLLLLSLAGL
jgi:hypothetical protein